MAHFSRPEPHVHGTLSRRFSRSSLDFHTFVLVQFYTFVLWFVSFSDGVQEEVTSEAFLDQKAINFTRENVDRPSEVTFTKVNFINEFVLLQRWWNAENWAE